MHLTSTRSADSFESPSRPERQHLCDQNYPCVVQARACAKTIGLFGFLVAFPATITLKELQREPVARRPILDGFIPDHARSLLLLNAFLFRKPEPDLSAESTPTGGWC